MSTMSNAITIYVSPDGDDNNDGTQQSPIKTYERAMEMVMEHPAASQIDIYFAAGTYDIPAGYKLTGHPGMLSLHGESRDTPIIRSTTRGPIFEAVGFVEVRNLCFQLTDASAPVLNFYYSTGFAVYLCKLVVNAPVAAFDGVYAAIAFGIVRSTEIQNCYRCITSYQSFVAQDSNTGDGNIVALFANAGIIATYGTIPTATTSYQQIQGGCINPASKIT